MEPALQDMETIPSNAVPLLETKPPSATTGVIPTRDDVLILIGSLVSKNVIAFNTCIAQKRQIIATKSQLPESSTKEVPGAITLIDPSLIPSYRLIYTPKMYHPTSDLPFLVTRYNCSHCPFSSLLLYNLFSSLIQTLPIKQKQQ